MSTDIHIPQEGTNDMESQILKSRESSADTVRSLENKKCTNE